MHAHGTSFLCAGTNALYQWSCSNLDSNNHYSLPDLEILDDHQDVADNRNFLLSTLRNELNIFPLPPTLNCSGTVTEVRFCYRSNQLGSEVLVFTLLTLEQIGQNFSIRNVINVRSTPTVDICTGSRILVLLVQYCCDTLQLDTTNQFNLPTPNFAFGIIARSGTRGFGGGLLTFDASFSQYAVQVEHYRPSSVDVAVGNTISVGNLTTGRRLRLFKFLLSKFIHGHLHVECVDGIALPCRSKDYY
jgi:hypothetical protein